MSTDTTEPDCIVRRDADDTTEQERVAGWIGSGPLCELGTLQAISGAIDRLILAVERNRPALYEDAHCAIRQGLKQLNTDLDTYPATLPMLYKELHEE